MVRLLPNKAIIHRLTDAEEAELARASRRVQKLNTHALLDTADVICEGMQRGLDDYRAHGAEESIREVRLGLIALQATILELDLRDAASRV